MLNKISSLLPGNNLQKATITIKDTNEVIPCQFNPQELTIHRTVYWAQREKPSMNSSEMSFQGSPSTTCSMTLYFDTTDNGHDVRAYTNQLIRMTLKGANGPKKSKIFTPPPTVEFSWGKFELFKAVLADLDITYTMFLPDGTPIRARASVTLIQNDHDDDPLGPQNPTTRTEPRKTRVIKAGERLETIANEEYGHPQFWRLLAEANDLEHVEKLKVGQVLIIPPID